MKSLIRFTLVVLLFGPFVFPAQAVFTSLYVFGDTVSTTTTGPGGSSYYSVNGNRYSNGRVWVEVLAQEQGIPYDSSKNQSSYDHDSIALVPEINNFSAPTNAGSALFIVWVNDADFVDILNGTTPISTPYTTAQLPLWTNVFNQSLTNHFQIITNLYGKGVRTLIMPNAVDVTKIPGYVRVASSDKLFFHQMAIVFNAAFTNTLNSAKAICPGLTIYVPDMFALLEDVVTNSAYYGLTNALDADGLSVDAVTYFNPIQSLNGPGTNFLFWDYLDPTARLHAVLADIVQHLISPAQISKIASITGSNRLDLVNVPIGLSGFVDGSTNLALTNWTSLQNVNTNFATQSVFVAPAGPMQFYRLRFPFAWSWP